MKKSQVIAALNELGLIAVIRGPSPQVTHDIVDALVDGGVKCIEITFTTPDAAGVAKALVTHYGKSVLIGMGTVTSPVEVDLAVAAGARFLVSPHVDDQLAQAMCSSGLLTMIGALTPSEVHYARELGADLVKLFPGSLVGPSYLKALRGPFPDLKAVPTGGVSAQNVGDWFSSGAFAVGAGTSLVPNSLMNSDSFTELSAHAREFVSAVKKAREEN